MGRTRYDHPKSRRSRIAAGKLLRFRRIGVVRSLDRILPVQEKKLSHQVPHVNAPKAHVNLNRSNRFLGPALDLQLLGAFSSWLIPV